MSAFRELCGLGARSQIRILRVAGIKLSFAILISFPFRAILIRSVVGLAFFRICFVRSVSGLCRDMGLSWESRDSV